MLFTEILYSAEWASWGSLNSPIGGAHSATPLYIKQSLLFEFLKNAKNQKIHT